MNDSDMHLLATDHGVCYTFKNSGVDGFVTSPGNGPCHSVYYRDLPNVSSYLSVPWLVNHPYTHSAKYIYCIYHLNCTRTILDRSSFVFTVDVVVNSFSYNHYVQKLYLYTIAIRRYLCFLRIYKPIIVLHNNLHNNFYLIKIRHRSGKL